MKVTIWVSFGRSPSWPWLSESAQSTTWRGSSPMLVWLQGGLEMLDRVFSNSPFTVKGRWVGTRHNTPHLVLYCNPTSWYRIRLGMKQSYRPQGTGYDTHVNEQKVHGISETLVHPCWILILSCSPQNYAQKVWESGPLEQGDPQIWSSLKYQNIRIFYKILLDLT